MKNSSYLKQLKYTDLAEDNKYNFILPIGSTEQHGPFIPFGTDTYITDHVISSVTAEFQDIIVLPTLEYSRSQEHSGFPGTVWLSSETLKAVLLDISNSLSPYATNIIFTSFHANDGVIKEFIAEHPVFDCKLSHLELSNDEDLVEIEKIIGGEADGHAGNTEISNMLSIDESLVTLPDPNYPKHTIIDPWRTDRLKDFSVDGIADNHPKWVVDKQISKMILDIYVERTRVNLRAILSS